MLHLTVRIIGWSQIKGLIDLLNIAVRLLTLIEFIALILLDLSPDIYHGLAQNSS
jgi:hypothetical protein